MLFVLALRFLIKILEYEHCRNSEGCTFIQFIPPAFIKGKDLNLYRDKQMKMQAEVEFYSVLTLH